MAPTTAGFNEQLKLTAGLINLVSAAFFTVGVVAPAVSVASGTLPPEVTPAALLWRAVIWILCGSTLHAVARSVVGRVIQ